MVRRERGATALELAMYMPLLFVAIFISVQFALMFFGNQAAAAAAREAARVARVGAGSAGALSAARQRGTQYAATVGKGVLLNPQVQVQVLNAREVRVVVDGDSLQVVPGIPAPHIHQVVQGPVESFRPDQ
jgi:Flp pilus assembly protein TadG